MSRVLEWGARHAEGIVLQGFHRRLSDIRQRTRECAFPLKPSLINEIGALSNDGVNLLIDFVKTPTDSKTGMEQTTYARQVIEGDLGVSLRFAKR